MTTPTIAGRDERSEAQEPAQEDLQHGAFSVDELLEKASGDKIDAVVLAVPGLTGLPRGKAYDVSYFVDTVVKHGAHAAGYLLTTDYDMRMVGGFALGGWEHGAGDVLVRPDLRTLRTAGWAPRTAVVFADAFDRQGRPIPLAPRAVLARQLRRLADLGLTASLGVESEAMVYDIGYRDAARRGYRDLPSAADHNTDYALSRPAQLEMLIALIRRTANASGLRLEAIKTEAGAGQLEVTFRHDEPMAAADQHLAYKLLAHAAAETSGMALTFMAKPFTGQDGNSCHLHVSMADQDGNSVLVDAAGELTETGRRAVAGCMALAGKLALLMLPTVNSYKRLHTDATPLFAPTTLTWGYDNRTCAIRVLGAGESGRIECRIPGADAQPHLAGAALLAAMTYGIEQKMKLTHEPVDANAYQDAGPVVLPGRIEDAAERLFASEIAADVLGPDVVAHYVQAARHEAHYHRARVSDLERERGFARA